MTTTIVRLDDLDQPANADATAALRNLAAVHQLPPYEAAYVGRDSVHVAVVRETADQWRAALGAPAFTEHTGEHYTRFKTEVLWFGITVKLSYCHY